MDDESSVKIKKSRNQQRCGSLFLRVQAPRNTLTPCIFPITFDSKTDSKTGRRQWIFIDDSGHSIGLWSGWKTLVDGGRRVVPKGGLEPPCPYGHNALNVACLPISPLRLVHFSGQAYITVTFATCQ